jgi:hypothetical protein
MKSRVVYAVVAVTLLSLSLYAQRGGRGGGGAAATPRASAPADLTGTWISVISEDWKFRMVTPPKGQYGNVPMSPEGRKVADTWDPAKDEAAGEQCKAYGAAGVMRLPGRIRISWESDTVLKIETEAGTQTRHLSFAAAQPPAGQPDWQGHSVAQWVAAARGANSSAGGHLKVTTTQMRPGYLRKNGVPYGGRAVMTEHLESHAAPNGDKILVITSIIEDSQNLNGSYVTSTNFKKVADGAAWSPTACSAR